MAELLLLVPRILNVGDHYWSPEHFAAWAGKALGGGWTRADVAAVLNVSPQMISYLLRGDRSPGLEQYLRMLAESREPLGTWLGQVDQVHNLSLADRHGWRQS
jgi:hypothetical protein